MSDHRIRICEVSYGDNSATPVLTHTSYLVATPDMAIADSAEAMSGTSGTGNALEAPIYTGSQHLAFIRPATEGDFTAVYLYARGARNTNSQLSAWTQLANPIDVGGEDHLILISNNPLIAPQGYTLIVEVA